MHKILIITESDMLQQSLYESMKENCTITACRNAEEALTLSIQDFDGLILDLFLPGMDGLTFLESARTHLPPVVLVLTKLISDYILQALDSLGAGYPIRIPCPVKEITHRMSDMFRKQDTPNRDKYTGSLQDHTKWLCLDDSRKGWERLSIIIREKSKNPEQTLSCLCALVAESQYISVKAVEDSIHQLIFDAWKHRDDTIWKNYFEDTSKCPSNKAFILTLLKQIH